MKVLVISVFPPDPAPEANHGLHISRHLAAAGVDVHVLCKVGSIEVNEPNLTVHPYMDDWGWSDVPRLLDCLRECQPDVVFLIYIGWVFNEQPMITFLPTFCQRVSPGLLCVTQFENVAMSSPSLPLATRARQKFMALRAGRGAHWLFGTILRDSARIITLSAPHRARLVQHDRNVADKCVILPPPPLIRFCTDPPAIAREQGRAQIGAKPGEFVWVCWGYIYPGKGIETLLQAFQTVCRRNPNTRLAIVGGILEFPPEGTMTCGDYYRMVRQLPSSLDIEDRVVWTGHFDWDSEEGSRYLYAGDGCVLPFESGVTLNNSSLAAAATHGLPVIGTIISAERDETLKHGSNIYLCEPRDSATLAEALELIQKNTELRERLCNGARELAREWYDWNTTTKRLTAIFEAVVSEKHAKV